MTFYELLTELCYSRGISPSKLCEEIGLSNATATKWKKGAKPTEKSIKLIADYFNMDTIELAQRLQVIGAIIAVEELQQEAELNEEQKTYYREAKELLNAYKCAPQNIKEAIKKLLEININI